MLAINNYRNDRERCEYSRQDGRRTYHEHDDHLQFRCLFDRNTAKDGVPGMVIIPITLCVGTW